MNEDKKDTNQDINRGESLHTLEGDLLSSMKNDNYASNVVKIVTHDPKHVSDETKISENKNFSLPSFTVTPKTIYIGLSILFLIILGGVVYYIVDSYKTGIVAPVGPTASTTATSTKPKPIIQSGGIFNADVIVPMQIAAYNKLQLIEKINQIKQELFHKKIKDRTNISFVTDVGLEEFLGKIQYSGPESLIRSLTAEKPYGFGVYHNEQDNFETYFITKVDIFDLAFSGMLEWESSMPIDLEKIYTHTPNISTSTSKIASKFTDKVIKNINTRIYIDNDKSVKIIYGIINKQYLLITAGENSFIDIVNKLLINNVLR